MPLLKTAIAHVKDRINKWDGPRGTFYFIEGTFEDESLWSSGAKDEQGAQKRQAELKELIGKTGDFEVDEQGEYQGHKKYKLKGWPGRPQPGGGGGFGGRGGGGREYVPRYGDTPEGFHENQCSIHRSVALQRAIEYIDTLTIEVKPKALDVADEFYKWLREPFGPQKGPASVPQIEAQQKLAQSDLERAKSIVPTTADQLPDPKKLVEGKSIFQLASEYITACDRIEGAGGLSAVAEKIAARRSENAIDTLAYKQLNAKLCQRAIDIAAVNGEFTPAEEFLYTMKKQQRIPPDVKPSDEHEGRSEFMQLTAKLMTAQQAYEGKKALQDNTF